MNQSACTSQRLGRGHLDLQRAQLVSRNVLTKSSSKQDDLELRLTTDRGLECTRPLDR